MLSWGLYPAVFVRSKNLKVATLKGKHTDWPWPFKWVPRRVGAFLSIKKDPRPKQLFGTNLKSHKQDVPKKGTWCVSWPLHYAFNQVKGLDGGIGVRYDYEGYFTWRFTIKKFGELDSQ